MIDVTTDLSRKLVIAHMSGMLTVAEVDAFLLHEQAAVRSMSLQSGEYDLLIIAEDGVVQTQVVMQAIQNTTAASPVKARRVAKVGAGTLAQLQSRRISEKNGNLELFTNVEDAKAWLERS